MEADFYILLETKLEGNFSNLIHNFWNNRWTCKVHLEDVGASGGILVL